MATTAAAATVAEPSPPGGSQRHVRRESRGGSGGSGGGSSSSGNAGGSAASSPAVSTENPTTPAKASALPGHAVHPRSANIIVIHVNDDARKMSKDFLCDRDTLLKHMRYFARFLSKDSGGGGGTGTATGGSDEVDISVHCDMTIFDWLVRYIHDRPPKAVLSPKIVASILISSHFLGIDMLVARCVEFIWQRLPAIMATRIDLCAIDANLVGRIAKFSDMKRLAARFDPEEQFLEELARLKLEVFSSNQAGTLLRKCGWCGLLLAEALVDDSECAAAAVEVDVRGELVARHRVDEDWSLHEAVERLRVDRWSWQEILWRAWSSCFSLRCAHSPRRILLSQLRLGLDRVVVTSASGTANDFVPDTAGGEEEAAGSGADSGTRGGTSDDGIAAPLPPRGGSGVGTERATGPRQLFGTHNDACLQHGHTVHVHAGTAASERAAAWLTFLASQKAYRHTKLGLARFQHQQERARHHATTQRRAHEAAETAAAAAAAAAQEASAAAAATAAAAAAAVSERSKRLGRRSASTTESSDDSDSDDDDNDGGGGGDDDGGGGGGDDDGGGDGDGAAGENAPQRHAPPHLQRHILHKPSPSLTPRDFVVAHEALPKQGGARLRRATVEFRDLPDDVAATSERVAKWRKDIRYKSDTAHMIGLSRALLQRRRPSNETGGGAGGGGIGSAQPPAARPTTSRRSRSGSR